MFPYVHRRISSPAELVAVLRETKACLASGTLRPIRPADAALQFDDIVNVPDDGPWPDYLEAHFEDREGRRFKLEVETYHGTGGSWRQC
jgi:hypothetical protein